MDSAIQTILAEKNDLERALNEVRELLERSNDEKLQLHKLYTDLKQRFEVIKSERVQYQQQLVEQFTAKKDIENQYESRIIEMRKAYEMKQKELDQLASKMSLPVDQDILRMRVQKDLEGRFRMEMETKFMELEKMTDAYYECKRQLEIYRTSLENQKYESEKIIQELKEKHKNEMAEIYEENHSLQIRVKEQRDKDTIRQVRRDLEEFKKRYSDASLELNEIRKEKDFIKLESNDLLIKHAKEIEEERNQRRTLNSENEKLKFRVKCLEDDFQKQCLKAEKKSQEANSVGNEKTSMMNIMKEKDIMIDSMKRQLNELREELHQREIEIENGLRKYVEDERDKGVMERKEKSKLQKEFEILEKNYVELDQQRKKEIYERDEEFENLQKKHRVIVEDRNDLLQRKQQLEIQLDDLKKQCESRQDEFDMIEREYKKIQEKHREVLNSEYNLQISKEHLEATIRVVQEEQQKLSSDFEESVIRWKKERGDLHQKLTEFSRALERTKDDDYKSKQKAKQYKEKLRMANNTIKALANKVAQQELDKYGSEGMEEIRVGGGNIDGRQSHQSKGSDYEMKEAISKVMQDENIKQDLMRILQQ